MIIIISIFSFALSKLDQKRKLITLTSTLRGVNKCITKFEPFNVTNTEGFEEDNIKVNLTRGNVVYTFTCTPITGTNQIKNCTIENADLVFPKNSEKYGNYTLTFNNSLGEYFTFPNKVCLTDSCYYTADSQVIYYGKKQRIVEDNTIPGYEKYNTSFKIRFNASWTGDPFAATINNDLYIKTRYGEEPTAVRTLDESLEGCEFFYNKSDKGNTAEVICPYSSLPKQNTMFVIYYQPPCWPSLAPTGVNITIQDRNETFLVPTELEAEQECNYLEAPTYFKIYCDLPNGVDPEISNGIANPEYMDYAIVLVKDSLKIFTECIIDEEGTLNCRTTQDAPEWGKYYAVTNGTGYLTTSLNDYKDGEFKDYTAVYLMQYTTTEYVAFTKYDYSATASGVTNYNKDSMDDNDHHLLVISLSKPYLGNVPEIVASYGLNDDGDDYLYNIIIEHCVGTKSKLVVKCPIFSYTLKGIDNGVISYTIRFADGCGVRKETGLQFNVTSENFIKFNILFALIFILLAYVF